MRSIFDAQNRQEIMDRITHLHAGSPAQWGKMNVYQMVRHNTYWNSWILGQEQHTYQQAFLGKIFGKIALKKMIRNDNPFDRNIPTSAQFKVPEAMGDLEAEKQTWISLTKAYDHFENPAFVHDFFGKMTKEQIGILVFKHSDHHLRQFGA